METSTGPHADVEPGLEGGDELELVARKYLGRPPEERQGTALCLSGGGYRAALFHLGALRRLNELSVLSKMDVLCTVSGGSILAAFLAQHLPWPEPGAALSRQQWDSTVARPFRNFTKKNIRTLWFFRRLLPWNLPRSTVAVKTLERRFAKSLVQLRLSELPERPEFIFCATDMAFGANWQFKRERVGDWQAGYAETPRDWTVARATAASACFPPVFDPQPIELDPEQLKGGEAREKGYPDRDSLIRGLRLTDGGVYDNMALEPVWDTFRTVLVSDAGTTLDFRPDPHWIVKRILRYQTLQGWQAGAVRKRWLISRYLNERPMGAFWGIGSTVEHYKHHSGGYSEDLVDRVISEVRADLDYFTDAEAAVLENHGYSMAEAAVRTHPADLDPSAAPFTLPHPGWASEQAVWKALAQSHKRKIIGRWRVLQPRWPFRRS